jgi:ATP-dependent protease ClpP protease subunit
LNRVVLLLASAGGQVEEGDRVIKALNEIKLRHQLITVVAHGKLCASMCIPIFLQGEDCLARYGGGDSSFHRRLVYRSKTSIGKD